MNQADAFQTAREQSTYLGYYMMNYGTFGIMRDPETRSRLIRGTAQSIEDCLNNRDCNQEKQKAIVQALVQRNLMQEVRGQMLVNATNAENMKSLDPNARTHHAAVQRGLDTSQVSKRNPTPTNVSYASSSTRPPLFQLDPATVVFTQNQQEILGPQFLNEYRGFVQMAAGIPSASPELARTFCGGDSDAADQQQCLAQRQAYLNEVRNRRFYRFVSPNPTTHLVQTDRNHNALVDQRAQQEFERETQDNRIKAIVRTHVESMEPATRNADGSVSPQHHQIGLGLLPDLNPAAIAQTVPNQRDRGLILGQQGTTNPNDRPQAIVRALNNSFEAATRRNQTPGEQNRGIASQAEGNSGSPTRINNVVLNPAHFDTFLENIWPSAAGRQRILAGGDIPLPFNERPRTSPSPTPTVPGGVPGTQLPENRRNDIRTNGR